MSIESIKKGRPFPLTPISPDVVVEVTVTFLNRLWKRRFLVRALHRFYCLRFSYRRPSATL